MQVHARSPRCGKPGFLLDGADVAEECDMMNVWIFVLPPPGPVCFDIYFGVNPPGFDYP